MNREQFIENLRRLLSILPENEREEAIAYYEGYFDDAGTEKEAELIRSLGSPEKVAQTIIDGYYDERGDKGEFTENGFSGYGASRKEELAEKKSHGFGAGGLILILILAAFALPILGPIVIALAFAVVGVAVAALAILCSAALVGGVFIVCGICTCVAAVFMVFIKPLAAVILMGAGLLWLGIGILLLILGVWILRKAVPAIIRWIVGTIRKVFQRKEV